MESIDTQTASGRMFLKIIGTFAEFERENISERIILGRERKIQEGYTLCSHTASYGYDRPNGQKIQTIIENEAQIVREIFDLYANQGANITKIAKQLNLRKVPTKHNNKWTTQGVRNILKNSNYIGEVRHHYLDETRSYTADGQHDQIISQELFEKAQHLLTKNPRISPRKQPKEESYFTGFLVCGECGYKMYSHHFHRTLSDGTRRFYGNYGCGNIVVGECDASEVSTQKIEKAFTEYIERIATFEIDNTLHVCEQEQKRKEQQTIIEAYEEKLRQIESKEREALDSYVDNVFNVEEYRKIKTRLDNDKKAIYSELDSLQVDTEEVADYKIEVAKTIHENWRQFSNAEKRMFLMQFVERIVIKNEKVGISKRGKQQRKVKIFDVVFSGEAKAIAYVGLQGAERPLPYRTS